MTLNTCFPTVTLGSLTSMTTAGIDPFHGPDPDVLASSGTSVSSEDGFGAGGVFGSSGGGGGGGGRPTDPALLRSQLRHKVTAGALNEALFQSDGPPLRADRIIQLVQQNDLAAGLMAGGVLFWRARKSEERPDALRALAFLPVPVAALLRGLSHVEDWAKFIPGYTEIQVRDHFGINPRWITAKYKITGYHFHWGIRVTHRQIPGGWQQECRLDNPPDFKLGEGCTEIKYICESYTFAPDPVSRNHTYMAYEMDVQQGGGVMLKIMNSHFANSVMTLLLGDAAEKQFIAEMTAMVHRALNPNWTKPDNLGFPATIECAFPNGLPPKFEAVNPRLK